jgi:hypothetical protein
MRNWKQYGSGRSLIKETTPEGLKKATKTLSQGSRSPDRDLKPGPSEHEAEVLTIQPRRSVIKIVVKFIIRQLFINQYTMTDTALYMR